MKPPAVQAWDDLYLTLAGAYSWQRPRAKPGYITTKYGARPRVGYSDESEAQRTEWAWSVRSQVKTNRWAIDKGDRYTVHISILANGRLDPDRVVSAVLDALQAGGAIRDDALVDGGTWERVRQGAGGGRKDRETHVKVRRLRTEPTVRTAPGGVARSRSQARKAENPVERSERRPK